MVGRVRVRVGGARYDRGFSPTQGTMDMAMDVIDYDIRGVEMQSSRSSPIRVSRRSAKPAA